MPIFQLLALIALVGTTIALPATNAPTVHVIEVTDSGLSPSDLQVALGDEYKFVFKTNAAVFQTGSKGSCTPSEGGINTGDLTPPMEILNMVTDNRPIFLATKGSCHTGSINA